MHLLLLLRLRIYYYSTISIVLRLLLVSFYRHVVFAVGKVCFTMYLYIYIYQYIYMYILYLSKIHVLTRPSTRTHVCSSNRVPRTTLWVRVTLVIAIPTGIVVAVRFGPTVYSFIHRAAELVTSFEVIITRAGATLPTESTRGRTTRPRLSRGHHPALRVGRRRRRHAARVVPHLEPPDGAPATRSSIIIPATITIHPFER